MPVPREAVIWGFRLFLGREPGSEETIQAHMALESEQQLAEVLIKSFEFSDQKRFSKLIELRRAPSAAVADASPKPSQLPRRMLLGGLAKLMQATGSNDTAQAPPEPPADSLADAFSGATDSTRKILILGNCQAKGLAKLIQAMAGNAIAVPLELTPAAMDRLSSGELDIAALIAESDWIFLHPIAEIISMLERQFPDASHKIKLIPSINFSAFHPDLVYIENGKKGHVIGPLGEYQSSLAFYGWSHGFSVPETMDLFSEDVFDALGFFDYWETSASFLANIEKAAGIPLQGLVKRWSAQGCWMHSINHPKLLVLADVARAILAREGVDPLPAAEQFVADDLADGAVWPVYPEIGRRLGIEGRYLFKRIRGHCPSKQPVQMLELEDFLRASFASFSAYPAEDLLCARLATSRYQALASFLSNRRSAEAAPQPPDKPANDSVPTLEIPAAAAPAGPNPYQGLPDCQFWRRAVAQVAMGDVDPVVHPRFSLQRNENVATAGSCFAQHISRTLHQHGFNYYIAEEAPSLLAEEARQRNFGVFSARYGNIYTARQLLQLFDRAYGTFKPSEHHWLRPDGTLADPFRPQIEPDGFASPEALEKSRTAHLLSVRKMFENLDVFVFTLGLTEAWRNREDGAVYPIAPGVAGGGLDWSRHEFVNFGVADTVADLHDFVERLQGVNPRAKLILTVSPVPLIATYEDRHVLVSTVYSKSVLRAAADEIVRRHPLCDYFPAYEIITGNYNRGKYFEDDLRSIKPEGVDHVMRLFVSHYSESKPTGAADQEFMRENIETGEIVCDEEAIDAAVSRA